MAEEPVAWLKEWTTDGYPRRRVDLTPYLEPWLRDRNPKVTPLYPPPQTVEAPASGNSAADDPNAPFRWICIHCNTVSGIDDKACLGCKKPRYPTLAAASGGAES